MNPKNDINDILSINYAFEDFDPSFCSHCALQECFASGSSSAKCIPPHYCCLLVSLTDTVEGLQGHMEELHTQMEELQAAQVERAKRQLADPKRTLGAQSVSCLKELYNLQLNR